MKKELLPLSAEERLRRIKKSIRGKDNYSTYAEHRLMKEYGIGHEDLLDFEYEKYLEFSRILTEEAKEEKKKQEKQQKDMDRRM